MDREDWEQAQRVIAPNASLCPKCRGMRFLQYDAPPGHPLFDAVRPCPLCRHELGDKPIFPRKGQ